MTLSDLWWSFQYCCYFVCAAYARSVSDSWVFCFILEQHANIDSEMSSWNSRKLCWSCYSSKHTEIRFRWSTDQSKQSNIHLKSSPISNRTVYSLKVTFVEAVSVVVNYFLSTNFSCQSCLCGWEYDQKEVVALNRHFIICCQKFSFKLVDITYYELRKKNKGMFFCCSGTQSSLQRYKEIQRDVRRKVTNEPHNSLEAGVRVSSRCLVSSSQ